MEGPAGLTPTEDAAYRAGMSDSRLWALEQHAASVNGTIKATGDALQGLSISVNDLRLTIKMLELTELAARVRELEDTAHVGLGVNSFKRYLLAAVASCVLASTAIVTLATHLSN